MREKKSNHVIVSCGFKSLLLSLIALLACCAEKGNDANDCMQFCAKVHTECDPFWPDPMINCDDYTADSYCKQRGYDRAGEKVCNPSGLAYQVICCDDNWDNFDPKDVRNLSEAKEYCISRGYRSASVPVWSNGLPQCITCCK